MSSLESEIFHHIKKRNSRDSRVASVRRRSQTTVIQEANFTQMLKLERRRTERSGRQFMLVLISSKSFSSEAEGQIFHKITTMLLSNTRETDILGWYEVGFTLGLLMTEIGDASPSTIEIVKLRISTTIQSAIENVKGYKISASFCVFPIDMEEKFNNRIYDFYPELSIKHRGEKINENVKRFIDIFGSLFALVVLSPVIAVITILIALSSDGPVFFYQTRIGQYGEKFTFFKFRTMYVNNDPTIHREYIEKLIAGEEKSKDTEGLFKLVNDPRITAMGKFLRRTSLDEIPQFINVLMGSMSLVGPRPPLLYEYQRYETWHKRRVIEMKPGLTGLWQVEGRSRTTFAEMVRLDLRYANTRSIWLDFKILIKTPAAMLNGHGAY